MKLQYAGDRRDFYKYDLLLALGQSSGLPSAISFVPMLTQDGDRPDEGKLRSYRLRHRDPTVRSFVQSLKAGDPQCFDRVADFFADSGVGLRFVPRGPFERSTREAYFTQISTDDLTDRIVFLDPDTGLEVASSSARDTRYLHYDELAFVFGRLAGSSVVVVYQHMPWIPHAEVWAQLASRLSERGSISQPSFLDMGDVGFIVAARVPGAVHSTVTALQEYAASRHVGFVSSSTS